MDRTALVEEVLVRSLRNVAAELNSERAKAIAELLKGAGVQD